MPSVPVRALSVVTALLLATAGILTGPAPALAAGSTVVVTSTADTDTTGACSGGTTLANPVTLRNALCVANNAGGAWDITVGAGTYALDDTLGPLTVGTASGADITLAAASGASPKVVGAGEKQVFVLDPSGVGGVSVTLDGLSVLGGVDNVMGGGALIGGSGSAATLDSLTIRNSTFSGNKANAATGQSTANPGGAIQFIGGALTVVDSTFTGNDAGSSAGGAIAYQAQGTASGEKLSITGSRFTGNTTTATSPVGNGGGALAISDVAGSTPMSITGSTFANNAGVSSGGPSTGSAVWLNGGSLSITGSTFTGNTGTGGSAVAVTAGSLTAHFNRITGNTAPALAVAGGSALATQNWWGCSTGPGGSGCDTVSGTTAAAYTPYLRLTATANPSPIVRPATTSTFTASLLLDSAGAAVAPSSLTAFDGLPVAWSNALPAGSSIGASSTIAAGVASSTFTAGATGGVGSATAQLDGGTVSAPVSVYTLASFTSPSTFGAVVGTPASFTVVATGYPAPALTFTGTLPPGLTATINGNGTATISGIPAAGSAGDYPVTVTARNAASPSSVAQTVTIVVQQAAAFTSAGASTFAAGSSGSFTVTASGRPTPTPITVTGTLPSGVTFTDHHDGTASIAGTPSAGSGGVYPVTLQTSNGVGATAVQSFTLTVNEAPRITSAPSVTTTLGTAAAFTVTTGHAYPAVSALAVTGTLPAGLVFADNGDGTGTISGTPTGPGGSTVVTITAANGVGQDATQSFQLLVHAAPVVTVAAADQTANVGATVSFTAAASGFPAPAVQWWVSSDNGASFVQIPGATSTTVSLTARTIDDGRILRAVFTNAAGSSHTDARLTVGDAPTISSPAAAEVTAGAGVQDIAVTTAGFPSATLTATGALPAWATFTDHHDGTATISADPPAASGGLYPFTITANNGFTPNASQAFVLTVLQSPGFTSAATAGMSVGSAGSFTVTTAPGFPVATTVTASGTLPSGLAFTDNGDGTATLSGTPAPGEGGAYAVTLTATNGRAASATQTLTVTVIETPTFTSPAALTVTRGVTFAATVTTGHAYPAIGALSATPLPAGLTFTDNGDGTASIRGVTTDQAGASTVTITATTPGQPDLVQVVTIAVVDAAAVPLPPLPPTAAGPLSGVPTTVTTGQQLTLTASGFAPAAPVTFGIYSSPVVLATVTADATGSATATVTIPAGLTGAHSLVATGIGPDGTPRFVRTDIALPTAPVDPGTPGTPGTPATPGAPSAPTASGGSGLAATGLDASGLAALAVLLLGAGAAVAFRRRPQRP